MDEVGDKKTPAMRLTFDITLKAAAGEWVPLDTFSRDVMVWLSDNAWEMSQRRLAKMQFNGDFKAPQFDPDIHGKGTLLLCDHQDYKGRVQENWGLACWDETRERREPSVDTLRRLKARWDMNAGATRPPAGKPAAPPAAPPKGLVDEDPSDYSAVKDDEIPDGEAPF